MSAWTSRSYRDEQGLRAMQALLMAARAQTDDWHYPHVGDLNWSFFLTHSQLDPQAQVRLWHDTAGQLVAYCMVGVEPTLDVQVLPAWVGQGVEDAALGWAIDRWQELCRADPARWAGGLGTLECLRRALAAGMNRAVLNTGAQNGPALALYRSLGFQVVNRWVQYARN